MSLNYIKLEEDQDGVVTIILNRPDKHNALNPEFIEELTTTLKDLEDEEGVRLLVLEGEGKSFSAGADLQWMKSMADFNEAENIKDSEKLQDLFATLDQFHAPVLAKVHGAALGGGMGLVCACDHVVASDNTTFGFTEVLLGIVPAVISPFVIRKLGESQARSLFLSGEKFRGEKALRIGLIHEVCDESELDEIFDDTIERFLKAGPQAARMAKKLVEDVALTEGKERRSSRLMTCQYIAEARVSEEGQEGMSALLEKRKPSWIS